MRAVAEVYPSDDAGEKFVRDLVAAWNKVMMLGIPPVRRSGLFRRGLERSTVPRQERREAWSARR